MIDGKDSIWHYFDRIIGGQKAMFKAIQNHRKIIDLSKDKGRETVPLINHLRLKHKKLYDQWKKANNEIKGQKKVKEMNLSYNREIPTEMIIQGL